jgi:TetR/AcrR family transcriptional regulator, transcriptional repressor for nem operon
MLSSDKITLVMYILAMRYKPGHKDESHAHILAAVGRGFRRHGVAGIGVDGLSKEAGVTSGAFYGHFGSKDQAFAAVAFAGLSELREGIERCQRDHGTGWIEVFVDFYLGFKRTCELDDACGLQALTPDVTRTEAGVRARYELALGKVVEQLALGLPQTNREKREAQAWALLALLSGGVTMARAMADRAHGDAVAAALRKAALSIARAKL